LTLSARDLAIGSSASPSSFVEEAIGFLPVVAVGGFIAAGVVFFSSS
jgi:hypothetical protein